MKGKRDGKRVGTERGVQNRNMRKVGCWEGDRSRFIERGLWHKNAYSVRQNDSHDNIGLVCDKVSEIEGSNTQSSWFADSNTKLIFPLKIEIDPKADS